MSERGVRQLDYQAEPPPLIRTEPFGWKDIAVIALIAGAPIAWFLVRMIVGK